MNFKKMREKSQLFEALHSLIVSKKVKNHFELESGRFSKLQRFTKIQNYLLESLYTINDVKNSTAFRIYLYLLRQITGYENKSSIELRPKIIKRQMNIGNSYYKAIECLKEKNMIFITEKDGFTYVSINPYPDTWKSDSHEELKKIVTKEINYILGKEDDVEWNSISSSSWSSSSSSSNSYPSNKDYLLKELDTI